MFEVVPFFRKIFSGKGCSICYPTKMTNFPLKRKALLVSSARTCNRSQARETRRHDEVTSEFCFVLGSARKKERVVSLALVRQAGRQNLLARAHTLRYQR